MKELSYDDVMLVPAYSQCKSRSEIDIATKLGAHTFKSPIIPANMKTVVNEELCHSLAAREYFYIMHRFGIDSFEFAKRMHEREEISSISVGVNGDDHKLIDRFYHAASFRPDYITVDIAHGHSQHMYDMVYYIKQKLPDTFVIAGNVCTVEAAQSLVDCGADCIKVGVAPGHACTTKLMTGFYRPQFSAVLECTHGGYKEPTHPYNWFTTQAPEWRDSIKVPIIADGGVKHNGDIAKAMVAGATMVMAGHLLAGFEESPGDTISTPNGPVKEYYGSASEHNKEMKEYIEGKRLYIPFRGSIWNKYKQIEESLRSSCSYGGVNKPSELKEIQWKRA